MNPVFLFVFVIIAAVIGAAVLFSIFLVYVVIIGHWKGAPFVRSEQKKIETMIALADIKLGERVIDLGSGDGTILLEAARRGAYTIGIEINPFLVWYTRWRAKRAGLSERVKVVRRDFRDYPLFDADVIFLYLWSSTIEELKEKLFRESKRGTRVISNGFPIQGWKIHREENGVYLYIV